MRVRLLVELGFDLQGSSRKLFPDANNMFGILRSSR
jgi:hypothetical protein